MRITAKGFTMIEAAVVLMVIGILAAGFSTMLYSTVVDARNKAALNQVEEIQKAIIGDPRSSGYLGDIGSLPASLSQLEAAGALPDYVMDSVLQLGAGWRGPYVSSNVSKGFRDPWDQALVYTVAAGTSTTTGSTMTATIRSIGADGQNGTSDDHVIEIYKSLSFSQVDGFVKDATGQTLPGITVKLVYPANGVIPSSPASTQTDAAGRYSFTDVPKGNRVLQLEPKLAYQRATGFTTGTDRNNVELYVENLGKSATNVSTMKITYTSKPVADFQQVLINGGAATFSGAGTSGTTVTFTATTVGGTGVIQEPFRVDVAGLYMNVPDAVISTVGTGQTIKINLNDFEELGTATNVDMTGVTITLEFNDGSKTMFNPVRK